MKRLVRFQGRTSGAIGIIYQHSVIWDVLDPNDIDSIKLSLYSKYEHISNVVVVSLNDIKEEILKLFRLWKRKVSSEPKGDYPYIEKKIDKYRNLIKEMKSEYIV